MSTAARTAQMHELPRTSLPGLLMFGVALLCVGVAISGGYSMAAHDDFSAAWRLVFVPLAVIAMAMLGALALVIGMEAAGVGLGTTAFVAYIARTTHPAYTATQLALFTSLMVIPRTLISAGVGWLVESLGWFNFFLLCAVLAAPGMLLLFKVAPWSGGDTNAIKEQQ